MLKPSIPRLRKFNYKNIMWVGLDSLIIISSYILLVVFSYYLGIFYRLSTLQTVISFALGFQILTYAIFGMYRMIIRYVSLEDMVIISFLVLGSNVFLFLFFRPLRLLPFPSMIFLVVMIYQWVLTAASRASLRLYRIYRTSFLMADKSKMLNTLIIGAGSGAEMIIKELKKPIIPKSYPVAALDDDVTKIDRTLLGVPIVGTTDILLETIDRYHIDEVIIAITDVSYRKMKDWLDLVTQRNIIVRRLPAISEIDSTQPIQLVDVKVEDLLNRGPVELDLSSIGSFIQDKVILVTGAGGSIGSELCRQIAHYKPKVLILFDIYENSTYDIQLELKRVYPKIEFHVYIGSVYNYERLDNIFRLYQPSHVFHAAAYKHVPLMEDSAVEALRTNVLGTYNVAVCAGKHKAKHFLLVSSDKAVRPTNVMGATKRLAELIIKKVQEDYETIFSAVRFGNVLNSNGSVVPLFRRQIEQGGPVTVTHPDITRYFMTIPEAVSLILQAGVYAKEADIFVLDMGQPVKIRELAEKMIRLSGLKPYEDIDIRYIGLRPGEKLYEELLVDKNDGVVKTANEKIFIEQNHKTELLSDFTVIEQLSTCDRWDETAIKEFLMHYVLSYKPNPMAETDSMVV